MRLMSFRANGKSCFGAATELGVLDLGSRLPDLAGLKDLIARDRLSDAQAVVRETEGVAYDYSYDQVEFLPPIDNPEKIWCIGVNYSGRNDEYKDGSERPQYPSVFTRNIRSFVGHRSAVERPQISEQLDYEGEIALIIGSGGRHIPAEAALDHIFGVTLCNEGTVRDWLRHGKFNVTQGKNFDRSGSFGPWIVTADEIDLAAPLTLTTRVNGAVRQQESTERLMFTFQRLIVYLSTFATLAPGDIISTGTPTGAGVHQVPPVWLKPGDCVEVEVPGIGTLRNGVVDER